MKHTHAPDIRLRYALEASLLPDCLRCVVPKETSRDISLIVLGIFMAKLIGFLFLLIVASIAGGAGYLAFWDVPPPTIKVERTLPDDQFPR